MEAEVKSRSWGWLLTVSVIASIVVAAAVLTLLRQLNHRNSSDSVLGNRRPIVDKYADALSIAMQFFDVQKCKILCI